MDTQLRVFLTGKIEPGQPIAWNPPYEYRCGKYSTWQPLSEAEIYKRLEGLCVTLDETPGEILEWLEERGAIVTVNGVEFRKVTPLLPQVPPLVSDNPDASFDAAPVNNFSFFAHLLPTADEAEQTAELEDDILDREDWSRGQW